MSFVSILDLIFHLFLFSINLKPLKNNNPVALKKNATGNPYVLDQVRNKKAKNGAPPAPLAFNFQVEMLLGFIIGIQAFDSIRASKLGTGSLEPRKKPGLLYTLW